MLARVVGDQQREQYNQDEEELSNDKNRLILEIGLSFFYERDFW